MADEVSKEAARNYWSDRASKVALFGRLWEHRGNWFATNASAVMSLDDVGYTLGVSSEEAKDLAELGLIPATKTKERWADWSVPAAAMIQWLEEFGPEWFAARTDRAVADLLRELRSKEERRTEAREDLLNALDALRSPEERAERSERLAESISMPDLAEEKEDPLPGVPAGFHARMEKYMTTPDAPVSERISPVSEKIAAKLDALPRAQPYTPREALSPAPDATLPATSKKTAPKRAKKKGG